MAFRPNYNQQRAERTRAREQKKQAKLQRRQDEAAKRAAEREVPQSPDSGSENS